MELSEALTYIREYGDAVNLIGLKKHKAWCFMLHGIIDTKLSTNRKSVYNIKQVLRELPAVSAEVLRTVESVLVRNFEKYPVPEVYVKMGSLTEILSLIKNAPCSTPEDAVQIIYFCLSLLLSYAIDYRNVMDEDENLLLTGLVYIVFDGLLKSAKLAGVPTESQEVRIYFNECDFD